MIDNESIKKGIVILDKADEAELHRAKRNSYMKLYMCRRRAEKKLVKADGNVVYPIEQVEA